MPPPAKVYAPANATPRRPARLTRPVDGGWELDVHVLRLDDDGVDEALRAVVDDTLAMLGLTPEEDR